MTPQPSSLREAAQRVVTADVAAESGDLGSDREWDEAMEALRAALAATEPVPTCEHEWEDAPDDEEAWYCPKCGRREEPEQRADETGWLRAAAEPPALDVERLARAIEAWFAPIRPRLAEYEFTDLIGSAVAPFIAAEYARLSPASEEAGKP